MNIIRLWKLYKQHYLKNYTNMVEKEYSCLGYFDCMSVEKVESRQERGLLETRGNINMTDLWYTSADNLKNLNGYYGQQSIGIFRYEKDGSESVRDAEFWNETEKTIILIGCMIQLSDNSLIKESMDEIESLTCKQKSQLKNIQGIVYRTFDNSDLILFIKGNSYAAMAKIINEIGSRSDVKYTYSICGFAQEYLNKLACGTKVEKAEYNGNKLINDPIDEVCLEVTADGKVDWRDFLPDFNGNIEYSNILGHIDNMLRIKNTDMHHVVQLLLKGNNGITHKNEKFGNKIYNISTMLLPKWQKKGTISKAKAPDTPNEIKSWCISEISKMQDYEHKFVASKNEMLFSNWLSIIQILNVLSQYENAAFSKNIFRIIFPSIYLICTQFEAILKNEDIENFTKKGYDKIVFIEGYINEVEKNIQHLIHTSQNFIIVPGYSGSLYDIPTKLLLFYMAFMHKLIKISNDSECEYAVFISPLINAKPDVCEFRIGDEKKEKVLLKIHLAQRHLFMPRALLVILSHELFHYVGEKYRCRQQRATCLIKMCSYAVVNNLMPIQKYDNKKESALISLKKDKQAELQEFFVITTSQILRIKLAEKEENVKYLADVLKKELLNTYMEILSEAGYGLTAVIRNIYPEEQKQSITKKQKKQGKQKKKKSEEEELLFRWSRYLNQIEDNRIQLLGKNSIEEIIDKFIYSFQEIHADLSTIICLDLEPKYYLEAIPISEGMNLSSDLRETIAINRFAVVIHALSDFQWNTTNQKTWKEQWEELVTSAQKNNAFQNELILQIAEYIDIMQGEGECEKEGNIEYKADSIKEDWLYFYMDGVWDEQVKYAQECITKLKEKFQNSIQERDLKDIHEVFALFQMYNLNEDKTYDDLFIIYERLVNEYNHQIDQFIKRV